MPDAFPAGLAIGLPKTADGRPDPSAIMGLAIQLAAQFMEGLEEIRAEQARTKRLLAELCLKSGMTEAQIRGALK